MSFPHNSSLKAAVKQLQEVVSRHQGDDHETSKIVREIESIVADIERKSVDMPITERANESQIVPPVTLIQNPLPTV
ncbi:MAG: hypothetical protein SGJ27_30080 [Candidatus Melainabacteria bacterium]|nr:hypothetical protein [Candidatus Melainabacteria bacterium]